jgi:Ran GTPase-activating protein (RanGAP) involved in mRNA processing and transport
MHQVADLAQALQSNSGLVHLNLYGNKLGDQAGKLLGTALRANAGLESLELGGNSQLY